MNNIIKGDFGRKVLTVREQAEVIRKITGSKNRADRRSFGKNHQWDTDQDLIACYFAKYIRCVDEVEKMAISLDIKISSFKARINSFKKIINHGMGVANVPNQVLYVFGNFETLRKKRLAS